MPTDQPGPSTFSDDDDDRVFAERIARSHHQEMPEDKIGREIYVMGGGTIDAVKSAFSKDHIGETVIEAAGSLALGLAVRAAEAKLPILRPAIAIGGAALTFSFVRDLLGKGSEIGGIINDTWTHKDHDPQNRAAFAVHGGKFAFDLALTSTAALGGSALGNRMLFGPESNFTRIATYDSLGLRGKKTAPHARLFSTDDPVAKLFEETKESSLKFSATRLKGASSLDFNGNAFVISEDGLAVTNYHCIEKMDSFTVTDHMGVTHKASVLASDRPTDVAILQLEKGSSNTIFKPLKLAGADANPGDKVFVVSHQSKLPDASLAPGRVKDFTTLRRAKASPAETVGEKKTWVKVHPFTREVIPAPAELTDLVADSRRMLSNYFSKEGVSGSPVVNTSGEIVGVHAGSVGPWLAQLTYRNDAIPVSSISKVLEEALAKRGSL